MWRNTTCTSLLSVRHSSVCPYFPHPSITHSSSHPSAHVAAASHRAQIPHGAFAANNTKRHFSQSHVQFSPSTSPRPDSAVAPSVPASASSSSAQSSSSSSDSTAAAATDSATPPPVDQHHISAKLFLAKSRLRARHMLDRVTRLTGRVRLRVSGVSPSAAPAPLSTLPRAHEEESFAVEDAVKKVLHPSLIHRLTLADERSHRPILQRWRRILIHLLSLGGASTGNQVKVYNDGTEAWKAMWEAIESARTSIRMESYIVEPDGVGRRTLQLLAAAQRRGVSVRFCYDSWGSSNLLHTRADLDDLIASGAQVIHFNPVWHLLLREPWRGSLWFRNHRKILIVDDRVGFCGGMNISSDYHGLTDPSHPAQGTGKFRDTHLRVEGPAVQDLIRVSRDTFQEAAHTVEEAWLEKEKQEREKKAWQTRNTHKGGWYPKRGAVLLAAMKTAEHPALPVVDSSLISSPILRQSSFKDNANSTGARVCEKAATCENAASVNCVPPTSDAGAPATNTAASAAADVISSSPDACPVPHPAPNSDLFVQVLPSNVFRNKRLIQKAMLLTVRQAKQQVLISNPYFFPPPPLFRALQSAAMRGVKVKIIMAGEGKTDVPVTRWASQHIYHTLLRRGVEIYELQTAALHAKTVTIDRIYSSIGSFNWDRLSARRNLEVNLTILDPCIAQLMEQHFTNDLKNCKQITIDVLKGRNVLERLLHRIAYYIMRFL